MLCSGLEGRSSNPVALLFDALAHPDADMGVESPSQLTWKSQREKEIPHVVLGRCAEGGAWQVTYHFKGTPLAPKGSSN